MPQFVWRGRTRAGGVQEGVLLADNRDAAVATLRRQAIIPLVEIARWKSEGHALLGYLVLARTAGYSDAVAHDLWKRGQRETVIQAAVAHK